LFEVCRELRDDPETRFDLMLDACGVDYPDRDKRFEAVYHLYSLPRGERLRLKVPLAEDDLALPSLIPIWKATNWFEREMYEMFGFQVQDHPNLSRLLTHEAFQGHPLRKDYDPARRWILTEDKIYRPKLDSPAAKINPPPPSRTHDRIDSIWASLSAERGTSDSSSRS